MKLSRFSFSLLAVVMVFAGCDSGTTNSSYATSSGSGTPATPAPSPTPTPPPVLVASGGPMLFFTDLASGPRTGNSDTLPGQPAGDEDGAIVTLWGKNLGAAQSGATLSVGGVPVRRVYYWGNAARGGGANLYARMGLQMVEFQIPRGAPLGAVNISVSVNGVPSNTLSFTAIDPTPTQGRIFFVSASGNNAAAGTFANPWQTFAKVRDTIANGDVVYFRDGFADATSKPDLGIFTLSTSGTAALPKALVAYPGATVTVGGSACGFDQRPLVNNYSMAGDFTTGHWVISKLRVISPTSCPQPTAVSVGTGFRLIGNYISNPNTSNGCQSGTVQCGGLGDCGNDIYLLGNEMTGAQTANKMTGSKQCHGFYISGSRVRDQLETNREIAWNYIHDNSNNRAINIYNEPYNPAHAYISGHKVHDNWIENQSGIGVLIGRNVVGENWFYNNVVINAGLGPDHSTPGSKFVDDGGYTPIQLNFGGEYVSGDAASNAARDSTVLHSYNNLVYGRSNPEILNQYPLLTYTLGLVTYTPLRPSAGYPLPTLNFNNNILVATVPNVPYLPSYSSLVNGRNNLWFGAGAPPAGEAAAVNPANITNLFENALGGNFHLKTAGTVNPAKDAGMDIPAVLPYLPVDFDGIGRPQNGLNDIGPYEAQ